MPTARGFEPKTKLKPDEKLKCAYLHLIRGLSQQDLADTFSVNLGRVNEAVSKVRVALEWPNGGGDRE